MEKNAIAKLKGTWEETTAIEGIGFRNGYVDLDGQFHAEQMICTDYIDADFEVVDVKTNYDDLCGFHPADKHAIYAAFGAALLGRSTWKINFEGNYTVMGIAAAKSYSTGITSPFAAWR